MAVGMTKPCEREGDPRNVSGKEEKESGKGDQEFDSQAKEVTNKDSLIEKE